MEELLKKQVSKQLAYEEKSLTLYAHNSQGHVYVLTVYGEEDKPKICGYFADSDLAYFRGKRFGHAFRIEKYRLLDWEEGQEEVPASVQEPEAVDEFCHDAVARLSFDAEGELIDFDSIEAQEEEA